MFAASRICAADTARTVTVWTVTLRTVVVRCLSISACLVLGSWLAIVPSAQRAIAQDALQQLESQLNQDDAAPGGGFLGLTADEVLDLGGSVVILEVVPGGPGADAGLRRGDLLTHVESRPVATLDELQDRLWAYRPGDRITLTIQRDGAARKASLTLGALPAADAPPGQPPAAGLQPDARPPQLLGVRCVPMTDEPSQRSAVPVQHGAVVTAVVPDSPADQIGLPPGAVIVSVDRNAVTQPADLSRWIQAAGPGADIVLEYYSQRTLFRRHVKLAGPRVNERVPQPAIGQNLAGQLQEAHARIAELEQRLAAMQRQIAALEALREQPR
jgi:predicted metalloprotease with PDZ domain